MTPERTASLPFGEVMAIAHEYEQARRFADAARLLAHVLNAAPDHAPALHLLGVVAFHQGHKERALALMRRAIALGIDTPLYYRNIGELYRVLGRHDEEREAARRAVALNPGDAIALLNCGIILADQNLSHEAIACFEQALAIDDRLASAHFGLAEALLATGALARGWEEYEWRFRLPGVRPVLPKTDLPQWGGTPIAEGALLLIADQGFGDAIQFCRYIPWAAARAADIVIACAPPLQPLLRQLYPGLRLVSNWQQVGRFAAWAPLSGLPRLAGTTLASIPAAIPYLRAAPARIARWQAQLDALAPPNLKRIGIAWAGRPAHKNDWKRSMTLDALAPVAALDGVALVVLQKGPEQRQAGFYYGRAPLVHLSAEVEDFEDTMAIMHGLDLVLTVDTSVAHLAGAMGRPVWILLPWCAEWRWLQHRPDSPWYPTARLFRQPAPNDWPGAAAQVAAALRG